jgi:hypothetical protein
MPFDRGAAPVSNQKVHHGQVHETQAPDAQGAEGLQEGLLTMSWLTKNWKTIVGVVSLVLNLLGGTGVIPPVVSSSGPSLVGH